MKITKEFEFSDNGCVISTITPETDVSNLSERAVAYGVKIGAIEKAKQAPKNKAKKPAQNKAGQL